MKKVERDHINLFVESKFSTFRYYFMNHKRKRWTKKQLY